MNFSMMKKTLSLFAIFLLIPLCNSLNEGGGCIYGHAGAAQKKAAPKAAKPEGERKFRAQTSKTSTLQNSSTSMGQLIGKNIITDDRVKGKISISSARKVPVSEAYNVMKAILEVKGLAVVETDNLIKILPIEEAVKKHADIIVDGKNISEAVATSGLLPTFRN